MDIFNYYQAAFKAGFDPVLLEYRHPVKKTAFNICGIQPTTTLAVRENQLFKDGVRVGDALDIFDYITLPPSEKFFPAYVGYFAYEFAEYFGRLCNKQQRNFPDAEFRLYEQGLVIDDGEILHHDAIEGPLSSSLEMRFKNQTLNPPINKEEFFSIVSLIKQKIKTGDVYQVNFSLPFSFNVDDNDMLSLYSAMRNNNKSPFMGMMRCDGNWILSGSPERLFSLYKGKITTRPIAGTKKRKIDSEQDEQQVYDLKNCPKENAEHAMLVDLMRNDLNQIAIPTTVSIDEDRSVEFYSHVMHLVSELSGETRANLREIFSALFPGGTVTGAPKANVMSMIADIEKTARGPYTGSFGYSSGIGCDFNILIRSVFKHKDKAIINAGAGIVMDSDENSEWEEIHKKAEALKDILENRAPRAPLKNTIVGRRLFLDEALGIKNARVLFVENCDSFSFNIVDALRSLGARVDLYEKSQSIDNEKYTHVVIGPGPGNPEDMPFIADVIQKTLDAFLPLLGICLGHQAIGYFFGARVRKIATPFHGKTHPVVHYSRGLFEKLPSPLMLVRYHSLAVDRAPPDFLVDAHTDDDCIMAIRHKDLPIFGMQFHPESYLSKGGLSLLYRFLQERPYGASIR